MYTDTQDWRLYQFETAYRKVTYTDTHDLCHVFILFTYDFCSGCTHCGKLRAEMQNVISKQCGVVDCGGVHVALEHLHHITDVTVVFSQLSVEPQGVQQIAFTDAGRDLVDLHMQVAQVTLQRWLSNTGGEELKLSLSMQWRHKVEQRYSSACYKPEHRMEVCHSLLISLSLSHTHTRTRTNTHTHAHARAHTHTHTHTHARTRTHAHTHTHTCWSLCATERTRSSHQTQG